MGPLMQRLGLSALLLTITAGAAFAQGTPALEAPLADQNPCRGLPAIDRLDFLRIDRLSLSAQGDVLSGEIMGAIGCRTSPSAFIRSSLATDIAARVDVALSTCAVQSGSVSFHNIRGSASELLVVLEPFVEAALLEELRTTASAACIELTRP